MASRPAPGLSPRQFETLAQFVKSRIGLHLRTEKRTLVESRLAKRLSALSLTTFDAYLDTLMNDTSGDELSALSQVLTTNVTAFFRESHHFDLLRDVARTSFEQRLARGEEVRLWSAGCSIGAEPYSMAITMVDALPSRFHPNIKILATDIDTAVLARAKAGVFGQRETEGLGQSILSRHFQPCDGGHQLVGPARAMVQFRPLNLVEPWPMQKQFAAILCRNVVIYFDAPTQAKLWRRFAGQLEPSGHLVIGHSERLDPETLRTMKSAGVTSYQKTELQGANS